MPLLLSLLLALGSCVPKLGWLGDAALAQGSGLTPVRSAQTLDEEMSSLKGEVLVPEEAVPLNIRKVAGDSPAATINRFLTLTAQAENEIRQAVRRGLAEPGLYFSPDVHRQVDAAVAELQQATQALDLSKLPLALRPMTGVGSLLMLRSVLAYDLQQRQGLTIPDADAVKRETLTAWTIPDTTISLQVLSAAQVQAGESCSSCSAGDFLFSSATLQQLPDDFERVFAGKYKLQRRFGADLYGYWALLPGGAIPPKLFLLQPVAVRRFLLQTFSGQSLLQWILLIPVTIFTLVAMVWWLTRLRHWQRQRPPLDGAGPQMMLLLAVLPLLLMNWAWQMYSINWVNLTGTREAAVLVITKLVGGMLEALLAYLIAETVGRLMTLRRRCDASGATVLELRQGSGQIMTLARFAGVLAAAVVVIQTGQDLGLTSVTLIGLASVPALAISLGTQQLIRDIADGFSLLLDGQIRAGDACSIGTSKSGVISGKISSMGMRSMRIVQDDGSILSMPNSQVAASVVTNHRFKIATPFNLSLAIDPKLLPRVQDLLRQTRQLMAAHPQLLEATATVEGGDEAWMLKLGGRWSAELNKADLQAAQETLCLGLIQLTHTDWAPAPGASASPSSQVS